MLTNLVAIDTAIQDNPNDFTLKNGYNLRPGMYNRHTELLICVTYYNEDRAMLARTLCSIFENVRELSPPRNFWSKGGPSWQKIVVCVIMDGIEHCDRQALDMLATIGVFQDDIILEVDCKGRDTTAHLVSHDMSQATIVVLNRRATNRIVNVVRVYDSPLSHGYR